MIKIISELSRKIGNCFIKLSKVTNKENEENYILIHEWFSMDGDKTLRITYENLTKDSLVFDLGAYKGQWASDIFSKYMCSVYCFEPSTEFSNFTKERFKHNDKINIEKIALSNKNGEANLSFNKDSSSIYDSNKGETIKLVRAADYIRHNKISHIDLMKINIEGGEYDLLEHLIAEKCISKIHNIQIQFHNFFPDSQVRMDIIQRELRKTHKLTYQYKFIWENWEIMPHNKQFN